MTLREVGNGLEASRAMRKPDGGSMTSPYEGGGSLGSLGSLDFFSLYFFSLYMMGDGGGDLKEGYRTLTKLDEFIPLGSATPYTAPNLA